MSAYERADAPVERLEVAHCRPTALRHELAVSGHSVKAFASTTLATIASIEAGANLGLYVVGKLLEHRTPNLNR